MAGVVLVHGAFHGAWCWSPVVEELSRRGVNVEAVELPFTGFSDDVSATRAAAEAMGPDVVLVGHSYGGMIISEAAVDVRSVRRLVYVTAFMNDVGEDAAAILAGHDGGLADGIVFTERGASIAPDAARTFFYGDSGEQSARQMIARLRPMRLDALVQKPEPAWKSIPSTYVVCTNDKAIPPDIQRWMAQRADEVVEVKSDHSPFVSQKTVLADVIMAHLP